MCEFVNIIEVVFNNWSSLKLCLEHGMGGDPDVATEKLRNLIENVHTTLSSGGDFYDLLDLLEDTLDAEFNTELQDASAEEVSGVLIEFYKGWQEGKRDAVLSQLRDQMIDPTSIMDSRRNRSGASTEASQISRKRRPPPPPVDSDEPMTQEHEPDPDAWTVVSRKK